MIADMEFFFEPEGESFAVRGNGKEKAVVTFVISGKGPRLVLFYFPSKRRFGVKSTFTARLGTRHNRTIEVLYGSICEEDEFDKRLKEAERKQMATASGV